MGGKRELGNISQCNYLSEDNISEILEKFWQIDTCGTLPKFNPDILPPEQKTALHILQSTTVIKDNISEVGLLWKKDNIILPYNRALAEKRWYSLEKKFTKNSHFKQLYEQQISDYIKKGYAKKLLENELRITSPITNYVPHHTVPSVSKPNKVRAVFDAAALYHETSLNNDLLPGLDILNNLVCVLCCFRQGEYAFTSDIEAIFHQVHVPSPDTDDLRFLWRKGTDTEIEVSAMRVHIFGKTDSPCAANWAFKQTPPEDDY